VGFYSDVKNALFHCILANNESGIIYSKILDIYKNIDKSNIRSADTIQCLGKTTQVDYNALDIFTFASQKLSCPSGLSGIVYKSNLSHIFKKNE